MWTLETLLKPNESTRVEKNKYYPIIIIKITLASQPSLKMFRATLGSLDHTLRTTAFHFTASRYRGVVCG